MGKQSVRGGVGIVFGNTVAKKQPREVEQRPEWAEGVSRYLGEVKSGQTKQCEARPRLKMVLPRQHEEAWGGQCDRNRASEGVNSTRCCQKRSGAIWKALWAFTLHAMRSHWRKRTDRQEGFQAMPEMYIQPLTASRCILSWREAFPAMGFEGFRSSGATWVKP